MGILVLPLTCLQTHKMTSSAPFHCVCSPPPPTKASSHQMQTLCEGIATRPDRCFLVKKEPQTESDRRASSRKKPGTEMKSEQRWTKRFRLGLSRFLGSKFIKMYSSVGIQENGRGYLPLLALQLMFSSLVVTRQWQGRSGNFQPA